MIVSVAAVSLAVAAQMAAVQEAFKKENRALHLHILSLEERIQSLEGEVRTLKADKTNKSSLPASTNQPAINRKGAILVVENTELSGKHALLPLWSLLRQ